MIGRWRRWVASEVAVAGMVAGIAAGARVSATRAPATVAACGAMNVSFSAAAGPGEASGSKAGVGATGTGQVPAGKAMVYLVEDIVQIPFNTPTLRIGMDGKWVGATRGQTYMGLAVDPGVHHLCVSVQGFEVYQLEHGITLRRLNAEAGKTYYVRMRETISRDPPMVFVDGVDEDEGQLLLETLRPAVWHRK